MRAEIYYFSGTGNSLHVARQLQKRLPGATLIPVIGALKKEMIKTNTESVGFYFLTSVSRYPFLFIIF